MANELLKQNYQAIADAIRSKTGDESSFTPNEMPQAIENMTTTEDMEVFAPDTTKYYQSSYGYSFYYPSGQTQDMHEVEGTLYEHSGRISDGTYYEANTSSFIGYNESSAPLTEVEGNVYAHETSLSPGYYYKANSGAALGYNSAESPIASVSSANIYDSSDTATLGYWYEGLGQSYGVNQDKIPFAPGTKGTLFNNTDTADSGGYYYQVNPTLVPQGQSLTFGHNFNDNVHPLVRAEGTLYSSTVYANAGYFYHAADSVEYGANENTEDLLEQAAAVTIDQGYFCCIKEYADLAYDANADPFYKFSTGEAGEDPADLPIAATLPANINESKTFTLTDGTSSKTYTITRTA